MPPNDFNFREQIIMSEGVSGTKDIRDILLQKFPHARTIEKSTLSEDLNGIDYWITLLSGRRQGVDVKARKIDFLKKKGADDLVLETWSVMKTKVGWTRDTTKRTDYIFWYWKDTGRWVLVSFPLLSHIFIQKWEEWSKIYPVYIQTSNGGRWESESVFVPRKVVHDEMYYTFGGGPKSEKVVIGAAAAPEVKREQQTVDICQQDSLWGKTA